MLSIWISLKFCCLLKSKRQNKCGSKIEACLTHYHTMTLFDASGKEAFSKHCGKGENAGNQHFLLFPQCFLLYHRQKLSFMLHLFCRLQMPSIWTR